MENQGIQSSYVTKSEWIKYEEITLNLCVSLESTWGNNDKSKDTIAIHGKERVPGKITWSSGSKKNIFF